MVAYCAITETFNTALMTETLRRALDPAAREAVRSILPGLGHHGVDVRQGERWLEARSATAAGPGVSL